MFNFDNESESFDVKMNNEFDSDSDADNVLFDDTCEDMNKKLEIDFYMV